VGYHHVNYVLVFGIDFPISQIGSTVMCFGNVFGKQFTEILEAIDFVEVVHQRCVPYGIGCSLTLLSCSLGEYA